MTYDLLQDNMVYNDGGGDGKPTDVLRPEDAELLEELVNHINHDDILLGICSGRRISEH